MEPVAAFSFAGVILQFVHSGSRFAGLAYKLYRSGAVDAADHKDLRIITETLQTILPKLQEVTGSNTDDGLQQLAQECSNTAVQLLIGLQKVNATDIVRKRDALKAAFRLTFKDDEIKSLQDRLASYRSQLNLHLLLSIRGHVSKSAEQQAEVLQKLGVVRGETANIGGIAASILGYLISKLDRPNCHFDDVRLLQRDLVNTISKTDAEGENARCFQPANIQLPLSDCKQAQSRFLASLQYDNMVDRESRIATAHESTFQWVLRDDQLMSSESRLVEWSSLRVWLESGDQLYWITGKAGSGKSTLMKFLCYPATPSMASDGPQGPSIGKAPGRYSRCRSYLERWAGAKPLVVASFYFWNSGAELQMSQTGLLRSLLFQIVTQRPDILPNLAPKEWEALCLFDHNPDHWATQDLRNMLFRAVEILRIDSKLCFFIDGLDEFDGSHEDLIELVQTIAGHENTVKICVASRPWTIFEEAFEQKSNLRLEDLTSDDIKNFVKSKLEADTEFENLGRRYPLFAERLIDNIVLKASGVFLWVDLVVKSLLAGMRLGDRIEDFQRRLDELPPDLEKLYEKILQSLDAFYLGHAAQYFALVETAETPPNILQLSFADEESVDSAIKMHTGVLSSGDISLRVDAINRRLNNRCKGFLEVERGLQGIQGGPVRQSSLLTVQYLHRTVRDFIKSPKAQTFLQSSTNTAFDPSMQLCLAYLMEIKTWKVKPEHVHTLDRGDYGPATLISRVVSCLRHAANVSKANDGAVVEILDELKSVISRRDYRDQITRDLKDSDYQALILDGAGRNVVPVAPSFNIWNTLYTLSKRDDNEQKTWMDEPFLSLACIYGVVPYVRARAKWGGVIERSKTKGDFWPLLLDALMNGPPDPKMVECLLDKGADPNFRLSKVNSQTPWMVALTRASLLYTLQHRSTPAEYVEAEQRWNETLRLMSLRGGAKTKVPENILTPISRKILQDLRDESKGIGRAETGWATSIGNWFSTRILG
ncbi:hypothetical protein O1611_g101 [Lasiodiplodia mahajangana]|uniref:Uncharacterized protein n=1 Tax=Lasiodiplodia mahajangana TaxID=1108764 RepID=A0ACC2K1C7_9PEZI|nr:hypothetical protein O1611_g101 [Lasiodiplodia mahajangana]